MTKRHEMSRNEASSRLLIELSRHVGQEKAVDMGELHRRVFGENPGNKINGTRALRTLITTLRKEGVPIGSVSSKTGGGYYICRAGSELDAFCKRLRRRALRALGMESKLRKVGLPELLGQMQLNLEEPR